ncbi:MAG: amino acid ABC transporter permease [Ignavibacteriales bacterium]
MDALVFSVKSLPYLLEGAVITIELSAVSLAIGFLLGLPLSLGRTYGPRPLRYLCTAYIEVIRGTPMLVQLFLIYYGLPDLGIRLDRFPSACLAIGLNSAAYQAEYFRGALQSVAPGQMTAALALGFTRWQAILRVVLPQAMRLVIPSLSNECSYLVLYTSVAFAIAVPELFSRGRILISSEFKPLEILFTVAAVYLVMLWVVSRITGRIEKRISIPGLKPGAEA